MNYIEWDDSFSVNIAEIDLQHKTLVQMINKLHDAMKNGTGKEVLGEIIKGLVDYASVHFETEEKYFDLFGYPETVAHKQIHGEFIKKVTEFQSEFEADRVCLSVMVMGFLSNWLQEHIKGVDKDYEEFFHDNGLG